MVEIANPARIGRIMRFRENFFRSLCGARCYCVVIPWPTREEADECAALLNYFAEVVRVEAEKGGDNGNQN